MKLFEYPAILDEFCEAVDRGEIPEDAVYDTLEAITEEADAKIDGVAGFAKTCYANAEECRKEAAKLMARAKRYDKIGDNTADYLAAELPRLGYNKKFESSRNVLSFRDSKAVEIADEGVFVRWAQENNADDLLTYKDPTPSKSKIKDAINAGREVYGAAIVTRRNLIIK